MTYQLPLAVAAALVLLATAVHVMLHGVRDREMDFAYLRRIALLGCLGGAALTPLIDHLGG